MKIDKASIAVLGATMIVLAFLFSLNNPAPDVNANAKYEAMKSAN